VLDTVKDYLHFGSQLVNGWRASHEQWIARLRRADMASFQREESESPIVLDLANGRLRPQYEILRAEGCRVYGIDVANHPKRGWQDHAYEFARWLYAKGIHANGSHADNTLVCGDVSRLPFQNDSFDVITSVAAFEHFLDVPRVLKEIHRVVRPEGMVWVLVHLFTCPSGGHNVGLSQIPLREIPNGIDAWDHLRRRRMPFYVPLNEWRRDQYLAEFQKHFEVLKHYCAMREGEHLLTPQIENELSDFSRDELTCGAYVIVARKSV
jgi:SAM-dependent methyltransferase